MVATRAGVGSKVKSMRRPSLASLLVACGLVVAGGSRVWAQADPDTIRFAVAADGNEARYLVREQLAGFDFPNDAVGRTGAVSGELVLDGRGAVVPGVSRFVIDVSTLQSDQARRDNFLRRNTLATAEHPNVVFVATSARGLPFPLPRSGEVQFQLVGDLTVRDVTRAVTWDVTARFDGGAVVGRAQTKFTFAEFNLTKPRVARVLSVADDIRLEYDFKLVPAPGRP